MAADDDASPGPEPGGGDGPRHEHRDAEALRAADAERDADPERLERAEVIDPVRHLDEAVRTSRRDPGAVLVRVPAHVHGGVEEGQAEEERRRAAARDDAVITRAVRPARSTVTTRSSHPSGHLIWRSPARR